MTNPFDDFAEELARRSRQHRIACDAAEQAQDWNAFPSYTLDELKRMLLTATEAGGRAKIEKEIAEREAGTSRQKVTPVVGWK